MSPLAASTDFSDFGLPSLPVTQDEAFDYGNAAQGLLNELFMANESAPDSSSMMDVTPIKSPSMGSLTSGMSMSDPTSPSPVMGDLKPLGGSPIKTIKEEAEVEALITGPEDLERRRDSRTSALSGVSQPSQRSRGSAPSIPTVLEPGQELESDEEVLGAALEAAAMMEALGDADERSARGPDSEDEGYADADRTINLNDTPRL
jgi:hypothetical protein